MRIIDLPTPIFFLFCGFVGLLIGIGIGKLETMIKNKWRHKKMSWMNFTTEIICAGCGAALGIAEMNIIPTGDFQVKVNPCTNMDCYDCLLFVLSLGRCRISRGAFGNILKFNTSGKVHQR